MAEKKIVLPHHHGNNEDYIAGLIPENNVISAVSGALKQLGDPSRLRIFWFLNHVEECVINISAAVGMSSPAVSHHLKVLKEAGLIVSRRVGKEVYYKAADTELVHSLHKSIESVGKISCPSDLPEE